MHKSQKSLTSSTKSRSKSSDFIQNVCDNIPLLSSPTNSHIFTKYTPKSPKPSFNNFKQSNALLLPSPSPKATKRRISIERVANYGNPSPSDSASNSPIYNGTKHTKKMKKKTQKQKNKNFVPCTKPRTSISRRKSKNPLFSVSQSKKESDDDDDNKVDDEEEESESVNNNDFMLELLTEINLLQREQNEFKEMYIGKINYLENRLKCVQNENNLLLQQFELYEHRLCAMERRIIPKNEFIAPVYNNNTYHTYSTFHTTHDQKEKHKETHSDKSSSDTKHRKSVTKKHEIAVEREQKCEDENEQKYESISHSITSLKFNANLVRKKRFNAKKFAPIQLENGDWNETKMENKDIDDDNEEYAVKFNADSIAISMPLIIDRSEAKQQNDEKRHNADISMLSEMLLDPMNASNRSYDEEEENDDDDDDIVLVLADEDEKERIVSAHSTSVSNVSELFQSESIVEGKESDSECFALFEEYEQSPSMDVKYTSCISLNIPNIAIPKNDKELFKKAKPAYKWHLEMIDKDGSILKEIEERKRRREKQKESKKKQQQQQQHFERKRYHKKTGECVKVCYFESKPLGFQINESPDSIFVTNVYEDRGSAYLKGIKKGWRIVLVNEEGGVREMMNNLRSSDGPFEITFDTNQDLFH